MAGADRVDAEAFYGFHDLAIESLLAIEDQIAWRRIVGKRLAQLLSYPRGRRMPW